VGVKGGEVYRRVRIPIATTYTRVVTPTDSTKVVLNPRESNPVASETRVVTPTYTAVIIDEARERHRIASEALVVPPTDSALIVSNLGECHPIATYVAWRWCS